MPGGSGAMTYVTVPDAPLLEIKGLSKHYGTIRALDDVSFSLDRDEIVGLLGDNGAGKSTLVKCLAGAVIPTAGEVYLHGDRKVFSTPAEARDEGIETVYQQLALVDIFDIPANFYLGREVVRGGWRGKLGILNRRLMRKRARAAVEALPARFPNLDADIETMSGGQRQVVAISRAGFWGGKLLLLDEPTAALGVKEAAAVLEMIGAMVSSTETDMAMIVISHNMEHVWSICTRLLILRQGRLVADLPKSETTRQEVVAHITGATV